MQSPRLLPAGLAAGGGIECKDQPRLVPRDGLNRFGFFQERCNVT